MRTNSPAKPLDTRLEIYYLPLFQFAEKLCGSPTRAILLTQDTFNLALERSRQLPTPRNLRAWLFTLLFSRFIGSRARLSAA